MDPYMVQIRVKGGIPEIVGNKNLPDGLITVHGQRSESADPQLSTFHRIQVEQHDPEGRYVQSAQHDGPVS